MEFKANKTGQIKGLEIFQPRQERSTKTQATILAAAREMLEEGGVKALTISGLAARAKLTTGAFYARFRNKEALLQTLFEETLSRNGAAMAEFLSGIKTSRSNLSEIIITFIPQAMTLIRDNSALFRIFGSDHSTPILEDDRAILLLENAIANVQELLQQHAEEIPDRDPKISAAMLVVMVQGMVDWSTHLQHSKRPVVPVHDASLADEISRAALGYLGLVHPD